MSWKDRLRPCVYISPGGAEFDLLFDEVSREIGKKAPVTEFPGQNSGAVQDLGQTTQRFPLTVYLSGLNYDLDADSFWGALQEPGPGELRHPRYGNIAVVPVSVQQTESLVDGANRAQFTIQFVEAIDVRLEFPSGTGINPEAISAQTDLSVDAAANTLAGVEVEEPGALTQLGAAVGNAVDATVDAFDKITDITDEVRSSIEDKVRDITNRIDDLVSAPFDLVESLAELYRLPAQTITSVRNKVSDYVFLAQSLQRQFEDITGEYAALFGLVGNACSNAIAAATAEASSVGTQATGADAAATNDLLAQLAPAGDDFASTSAVRKALTLAQQAQWDLITELPIEQKLVLDYDEALIPLINRLYTTIDDLDATIEEFIEFNDLQGSAIFIVPAGTIVRWYE